MHNKFIILHKNRNFSLMWCSQVISATGTQISQLAFPLLVLLLTHSPVQAGLIGAFRGLPYVLFSLPIGILVDRWDRKRVMILCDIGRATAIGSVFVAIIINNLTLIHLYLVSFLEGTLFIFFSLAETACLPRIVPKGQLATAIAQNQIIYATSELFGPSLGGLLYGINRLFPFLADTISYLFSVILLFFIKADLHVKQTTMRPSLGTEIIEGIKWLGRQPLISFIALLNGGIYLLSIGYPLIIIMLAQNQHASSFTIGLVLASGGIGSVLGAYIANWIHEYFSFNKVIIIAIWIWLVTCMIYAISPNPLIICITTVISSINLTAYDVVQFSYRLTLIPDQIQGRVNSIFRLISWSCQPIGLALTGVLLQAIGPISTILALSIPQFILAAITTANMTIFHSRGNISKNLSKNL